MTYGDCKTNKLICNIAQSFWHREPILRQWQALSATLSLQINSNNMAFWRFKFFCRVVYVMEIFSLSIALSSRFLFFYREKLFTHTTTYKAIYFPKVPDCFFSQHKNAITLSKAHSDHSLFVLLLQLILNWFFRKHTHNKMRVVMVSFKKTL